MGYIKDWISYHSLKEQYDKYIIFAMIIYDLNSIIKFLLHQKLII